jgi:anti-sigma regulatory factor (Ser/Thr protein kinase)
MSDSRRLHISFKPTFGNVDMVRAAVRGACADFFRLDDNAVCIMDFCLIVTELMNNAVEHSHAQVMDVDLILSEHEALFRLISSGTGFDPTLIAAMPHLEPGADLPEGGYGLALIQMLADGMEYERRKNMNLVTIRKTFRITSEKES